MISFSLTSADFSRLQKVVARRIQKRLNPFTLPFWLRVLTWLCIGLAGATYARLYRDWPEISGPLTIIAITSITALLVAIVIPHFSQSFIRKYLLQADGAFLSQQTISFNSTALRVESKRGITEVPWAGFLNKAEDSVNIYLFIDVMQAVSFHVHPWVAKQLNSNSSLAASAVKNWGGNLQHAP